MASLPGPLYISLPLYCPQGLWSQKRLRGNPKSQAKPSLGGQVAALGYQNSGFPPPEQYEGTVLNY